MYSFRLLSLVVLLFVWGFPACAEEAPKNARTVDSNSSRLDGEIDLGEQARIEPYSPLRSGKSRYDWNWLAQRFDTDHNGIVTRRELVDSPETFRRLDRNWDEVLTADDFDWSSGGRLTQQKETTFALFKFADKDSDGRINVDEFRELFEKSTNGDGVLDEEELEKLIYLPKVLKAKNEYKSRASHSQFQADDAGNLPVNLPAPGEFAPDFELRTPASDKAVRLSSFRGKKPVALIFGCLTCGNYRTYSPRVEAMYRQYKDDVEFLRIYVREAHPSDTHRPTATNAKAGILIRQPVTLAERCQVASKFTNDLKIETPVVVDGIDNRVGQAYGGWPDRLYLIDREGKVVYQGGPGPFAFNPSELEQHLLLLQLDESLHESSQSN